MKDHLELAVNVLFFTAATLIVTGTLIVFLYAGHATSRPALNPSPGPTTTRTGR